MPEVAVVIPTRGRWPLFSRMGLRSCLLQEGADLEIIVVDDGSEDGTSARLRELGDARVTTIRHAGPRGLSAARNAGVTAATAPWVAFLDDDDLWSPLKLRAQLDGALRTGADLVYGSAIVVTADLSPRALLRAPDPERLRRGLRRANLIPAGASNVVARTALIRDCGGFDGEFRHLADWDLWLRLAARGRAAAVDDVLVAYVQHDQNMQMTSPGPEADLDYFVRKHALTHEESRAAGITTSRWRANALRLAGRRFVAAKTHARAAYAYRSAGGLARAGRVLLSGSEPRSDRPRPSEPAWLAAYR